MKTTNMLLTKARNRVVLLYIGARLKEIDIDCECISSTLICAAVKGLTPTFFGYGDCYSAQELIDVACKFIYRRMEGFLYDDGDIKKAAFEECSDPENEYALCVHILKNVLDFKHFKDVDARDVKAALLSNTEELQEATATHSGLTADTGDGLHCQRLIEKAIRDYQNA